MSSTSSTTPTTDNSGSAANNPVIEAEPVVTVESSTTPETNDKGSSFNWKTAAIIGAATIGLAILVVAIVLLVKHIRKKKEEGKEEGKEGEKDKEKDNDKSKGNDKDKKEGKDKDAKTTEKEGTKDKPETKNFTLFVNGEERIVKGKLNKETGKYQVIIPRTKKSIQDNIVKVSNSNNQIITATQQKKEQSNNELEAIKEQLKTLQGELDVKKNEQDNINQFAKAVNNMGSNLLNNVLGGNILEIDGSLPPAPVENQNALISKEAINNSMKKENDLSAAPKPKEDVTEYIEPKVIKQEVQTSLETANKAKEEAQGNSLS